LVVSVYGGYEIQTGFKEENVKNLYCLEPKISTKMFLEGNIAHLIINSYDLYQNNTFQSMMKFEMFKNVLMSIQVCLDAVFQQISNLKKLPFYLYGGSFGGRVVIRFAQEFVQKYGNNSNNSNKLQGVIVWNGRLSSDDNDCPHLDPSISDYVEKLETPLLVLTSGFDHTIPIRFFLPFYEQLRLKNKLNLMTFFIVHSGKYCDKNIPSLMKESYIGHFITEETYEYIITYIKSEKNEKIDNEVINLLQEQRVEKSIFYTQSCKLDEESSKKFQEVFSKNELSMSDNRYKALFFLYAHKKFLWIKYLHNKEEFLPRIEGNIEQKIKQLRSEFVPIFIRSYFEMNDNIDKDIQNFLEKQETINNILERLKLGLINRFEELGFDSDVVKDFIEKLLQKKEEDEVKSLVVKDIPQHYLINSPNYSINFWNDEWNMYLCFKKNSNFYNPFFVDILVSVMSEILYEGLFGPNGETMFVSMISEVKNAVNDFLYMIYKPAFNILGLYAKKKQEEKKLLLQNAFKKFKDNKKQKNKEDTVRQKYLKKHEIDSEISFEKKFKEN
jgi:hypothetical protein